MKKLNLNLGSLKDTLSKEQMKKVSGGYDGITCSFSVGAMQYSYNCGDYSVASICEMECISAAIQLGGNGCSCS